MYNIVSREFYCVSVPDRFRILNMTEKFMIFGSFIFSDRTTLGRKPLSRLHSDQQHTKTPSSSTPNPPYGYVDAGINPM